ncbi:MAG TPA: 2Fe-2S iron-sulfur cluster-binding protein, partial [Candidatus Deferrimicrobiaceae bacterium]
MPKFTLNGMSVEVPDGTTILEAAKSVGVEIPHYCYHPKLSIAGSCRMCLVEVEKFPKLQTACSTVVGEGMVVRTDTEKVRKAVTGVLELILIHHPVDCPICDQAGECGLQNYYMKYGLHKSRYALEDKVHKKKVQDLGGMIVMDAERCILCSRCIRFLREVTRTGEMEFFNRGDHSEISIFPGRKLDNHYTGNLADICPVGALTNRDFRFRCRVWFLNSFESICTGCANGCNVTADHRGDVLYRLKPRRNDAVNGCWMCDFGRVEYKKVNDGRLLVPVVRDGAGETEAAWESVLNLAGLRLAEAAAKRGPESVAVIASPQSSNEELWLVRRLAREVIRTPHLAFSARTPGDGFGDDFLIKPDKNPNTKGAQLLGIEESRFDAVLAAAAEGKLAALLVFGNVLGALPD